MGVQCVLHIGRKQVPNREPRTAVRDIRPGLTLLDAMPQRGAPLASSTADRASRSGRVLGAWHRGEGEETGERAMDRGEEAGGGGKEDGRKTCTGLCILPSEAGTVFTATYSRVSQKPLKSALTTGRNPRQPRHRTAPAAQNAVQRRAHRAGAGAGLVPAGDPRSSPVPEHGSWTAGLPLGRRFSCRGLWLGSHGTGRDAHIGVRGAFLQCRQ